MINAKPPATSEDLLGLVRQALDEFDTVPLEATLRRTVRIANLVGDTLAALRIGLELKPSGGHPPANAEMTRRLMVDVNTWDNPEGVAQRALDEYIAERRMAGSELIMSHCIAEIEFYQRERIPAHEMTNAQYGEDLTFQREMVEILTRARYKSFTYLCQWERQLTFAVNQDDALAAVRNRVDTLLSRRAPEVLDRFNVAFRRLREAVGRNAEGETNEELSQALMSCRRILKAVVDVVQPADPARVESDDGHRLTDEHYKNRLVEFLRVNVTSSSFRSALIKDGESLFERFGTIDDLSSKGVHSRVALDEATFCALHTYTLAGEILALAEPG